MPGAETPTPPEALWLSAPAWRDNRIRSTARGRLFALWFAAFVGLAVSVPIFVFVPEEIAGGNPWAALAFVFPTVALPFAIAALRRTIEWRRYGGLALVMDPFPGSLGGDVGGSVVLPVRHHSSRRFAATLACSRIYESGSGDDRTTRKEVIWARDGVAETAPTSAGTRVSFRFAVPGHLPESEPVSDDYRGWSLRLRERGRGIRLDRTFDVPVFATGGARSEARIRESHEALVDGATVRLPPRVVRMRHDGIGVELVFPPLRNVLASIVPAAIFLGVGGGIVSWVMLDTGADLFESDMTLVPLILGGLFALVGLVAIVFALGGLGHGATVRATVDEVVVRHRLFGIPTRTRRMAAASIVALDEEVGLRAGWRSGSARYRCLVARDLSGARLALAEGIRDPAVLRHLRDEIAAACRLRTVGFR